MYKPGVCAFLILFGSFSVLAHQSHALELDEKRQLFLDAEKAIQSGAGSKAEKIIQQLGDYPLVPYLELSSLLERVNTAEPAEIDTFLARHPGSWLAEKLRINWLITLDAQREYDAYIHYYKDSVPSTVSNCRYAEALIRSGREEEAFQLAPNLWLSGYSRPDQCDYLFERWQKSASFSEEYIWQRFVLARNAGQTNLASYLRRLARSDEIDRRIDLYFKIQSKPDLVLDPTNISVSEPGYSDLIRYGIRQLATSDPYKAETTLRYYQGRLAFSEQDNTRLVDTILRGYTRKDVPQNALALARSLGQPVSSAQVDWQMQRALDDLDWQRALDWISLLLPEEAEEEKWRYWRARAQNQLGISSAEIYQDVARERSYYGFLSAMMVEAPYQLGHSPIVQDPMLEEGLKQRPGVLRAAELHAVGYYNNARRAWNYAISDLQPGQRTVAAKVALELGIHYEAIRSMAAAKYWNDLDIRFPLAYLENYRTSSQQQAVDLSWIYGISRQESSFAPDIRSSSGAMGLMQVMPATARDMARDIGVPYKRDRLIEPEYNIPLGTAYLSKGRRELQDNMVYATAGYNAGINRASQWLEDDRDKLPLDVWIETIPYSETRKYVKNVLAYSVIFADKLGLTSPMEHHSQLFFTELN